MQKIAGPLCGVECLLVVEFMKMDGERASKAPSTFSVVGHGRGKSSKYS